ncbi:hypothetical protein LOY70_16885 [Pseudomonas sp. B21-054]|uniref:HvfA family oxazolone/thioamide-modified RiPP metallophore n=1 Tax=Pseudomonas sp. B21-054 TaxID=2895494 RepID=UPI0022317560|nr:hypothetical protein [Pseudomonas sp. B21-054]UZE15598.1 hypothetical protein LOY70_16885 [Pseudomonas sp. B21-054]
MHAKNTLNTARLALATLAISGGFSLAQSAFAVEALPQGYQLASAEKTSEGKCGEGKCGAANTTTKVSQSEGKCGEGKCGDASFARTDNDHDDRVSLKEFLAVAPTQQAEFEKMDSNHDGYLSEAETYKYRTGQYTANGKKVPTELFTRMSQAKE